VESAAVVRQSGGDFLITEGPYTETKEHLAGFWTINAAAAQPPVTAGSETRVRSAGSSRFTPVVRPAPTVRPTG